jgi:anaerobic magnesium-protoporphyrin IX monomethyl ester cyclase
MKICLVYVGVGVAGFNANRPPGDREGAWIGHGIASVGASLKAAGHTVNLIDLRHLAGWTEFGKCLTDNPADVFGLSVSPVDGQFVESIAVMIKYLHPAARIIAGGIHPTIFADLYECTAVDTVVKGEGEVTFVDLINRMERNEVWPRQVQAVTPNLDAIPWVDRELFDYNRELDCYFAPGQELPSITMLAGRGCPYLCSYCQPAENAVFGKPFRIRSPENVVAEMKALHERYAYKSVTFWDDTFTINKSWVMKFCDLYEQSGIGATIAACSRADIICRDEEMIERMAQIGVNWFVIGLESGSQRILDLIKKGTTVEQNVHAAEICRKYGIKIFGTYMYGLPTETNEEALMTAKMIDTIQPEHASPFYFLPIKGTDIYTLCEEKDLLMGEGSIERTGMRNRAIRGVDYDFLDSIMQGNRVL